MFPHAGVFCAGLRLGRNNGYDELPRFNSLAGARILGLIGAIATSPWTLPGCESLHRFKPQSVVLIRPDWALAGPIHTTNNRSPPPCRNRLRQRGQALPTNHASLYVLVLHFQTSKGLRSRSPKTYTGFNS